MTITKRTTKGTALTYAEMDENIRDLREDTDIDRVLENGNTTTRDLTLGNMTSNGITSSDNLIFSESNKGIYLGTTTPNSSNLLNDFQQGTFTPTLTFGGGNTGQSIAYQYGNYQKIGFNCYIQIGMSISNIGTDTGSAKVALPFPVYNNTGSTQWEGVLNLWFLANGGTMPTGSQAVASDTNGGIVFADWNSATLLTHTEFGTNPNFRISGHYRIA